MFALRKVTKDGVELNFALGDSYTLVMKETAPGEFERGAKDHPHYEDMYGFLTWRGGAEILPLYKNQWNYIVSENGATYSNLSCKK